MGYEKGIDDATDAEWMPIATLVAMKTTLEQSSLRGAQRLVGAVLGAAIAAVLLVTVTSHHALEELVILIMGVGIAIRSVNYAFYTAAIAGAVLLAMDLPSSRQPGCRGTAHPFHIRRYWDCDHCDGPRYSAPETPVADRASPTHDRR